MNFTIWSSPINRWHVTHLYTTKQYFLHISNVHSFHVALFSFYTFFILHFSCIPLFSYCTFFSFSKIAHFHVAIFHVTLFLIALFPSSTLFMLHFFHAVLFSCCTFQKHQEIKFHLLYIKSLIETLSDISSFRRRYDKYNLLRVPMQACS